jgi:hypothetical protein
MFSLKSLQTPSLQTVFYTAPVYIYVLSTVNYIVPVPGGVDNVADP